MILSSDYVGPCTCFCCCEGTSSTLESVRFDFDKKNTVCYRAFMLQPKHSLHYFRLCLLCLQMLSGISSVLCNVEKSFILVILMGSRIFGSVSLLAESVSFVK